MEKGKTLNVLFAAAEVSPFAKTGGLADVAGALPRALAGEGCRVAVLMPLYGSIDKKGLQKTPFAISVSMGNRDYTATLYKKEVAKNVTVWFLHQPVLYYSRAEIYGNQQGDHEDNDARFAFFNRAVAEFPAAAGFAADVIHVNDWHLGLVPLILKRLPDGHPAKGVPTVFSIHNLAYQGLFPRESLAYTGLPETVFTPEGVEIWGKVGFMKTGVLFADQVTAVSPTYAREILGKELGFGLEGVLNKRKKSLTGILNGVDMDAWDPATDPAIPFNFTAKNLKGKAKCREALAIKMGLKLEPGKPVAGIVSRLIEQKGFDMVIAAEKEILKLGVRLAVLGTGQPKYENYFQQLARRYPGRVGVQIGYDENLAHLVEAGSDMFLMPSLFEPCGLNQMYSFRYGTIPVVRATGGLADTVRNWQPAKKKGNGFLFRQPTAAAFIGALKTAVRTFEKPAQWARLMRNAMAVTDFSWQKSAQRYLQLYKKALR